MSHNSFRTLLLLIVGVSLLFIFHGYFRTESRGHIERLAPLRKYTPHATATNSVILIYADNDDLHPLKKTLRSFEDRFNKKFKYPYVVIGNGPFSDTFRLSIATIASNIVEFGQLPEQMHSYPSWIDQKRAAEARKTLASVANGDSEAFRHRSRYYLMLMQVSRGLLLRASTPSKVRLLLEC